MYTGISLPQCTLLDLDQLNNLEQQEEHGRCNIKKKATEGIGPLP